MIRWIGYGLIMACLILAGCGGGGSSGGEEETSDPSPGATNTAPLADAGKAQSVKVGDTVTLNASESRDEDGDTLTYAWSLSAQPDGGGAVLADSDTVKPTFVADTEGEYTAQVIVNDGQVDSEPATVTVTATIANSPPVADAGADQSAKTGEPVTLDGSASTDADGDLLTYQWALTEQPGGSVASLSDANTVDPSFTPDVDGEYVLTLTVSDGEATGVADQVTVTAATPNSAPTADAGEDQSVLVSDVVTLNGSASADPDGDALLYSWRFVSRPAGSSAPLQDAETVNPTFTADVEGDFVIELLVGDGEVDSNTDNVTVSATKANVRPVADAGTDQSVVEGDVVTLDASGSSDPDGDTLSYHWRFVSKPFQATSELSDRTSVAPTFTADAEGTYTLALTVNDGEITSEEKLVRVTASEANAKPVANAGGDINAMTGTVVTLDGSASTDANGDPLSFGWAFVSRPDSSAASLANAATDSPSFTPDVDGAYIVELVVNDGQADSAGDRVQVNAETANSEPVADAGRDQTVEVGRGVTLDGSASIDADGDTLTYTWTFQSRPDGSVVALTNPGTVAPSFTPDVAGDYVVSLTVNDGNKTSRASTVRVTAIEPELTLEEFDEGDVFDPAEWRMVGLPYTSSSTLTRTSTGESTITLAEFRLKAIGRDYTLQGVQVEDPTGSPLPAGLNPRFVGLTSGIVISEGDTVTFELVVDKVVTTNAQVRFSFEVGSTGDQFQSTYTLTLR